MRSATFAFTVPFGLPSVGSNPVFPFYRNRFVSGKRFSRVAELIRKTTVRIRESSVLQTLDAKFRSTSRQTKDAVRLGIQASVAAGLTLSIMLTLGLPERFVGILSATMVVEPNIGNTLVSSQHRLVGALVGSIIGITCFAISPIGFGSVATLSLAMLLMNGLAGFRPHWRYGVVAAVALVLKAEGDGWQVALERLISIGLGIGIGTIVCLVVWPQKASTRAADEISECLQCMSAYLRQLARHLRDRDAQLPDDHTCWNHLHTAKQLASTVRWENNARLRNQIKFSEELLRRMILLRLTVTDSSLGNQHVQHLQEYCERTATELEAIKSDDEGQKILHEARTVIDQLSS